jgi:hypothetical protein
MLDPQATGKIDAGLAAGFLKKSQLREPVLHKVRKSLADCMLVEGGGGCGQFGEDI